MSCKPAAKPTKTVAGPQVRATVVTIRTTIQPGNKTTTHTIVIADGRARSTGEQDTWRLFDTRNRTVTFVDDIARTVRTEAMDAIEKKRRVTLVSPLSPVYPRAKLTRTAARRTILGMPAQQTVLEVGAYRRELWLADPRPIPRNLFAMMHGSETPTSPLAPMMQAADEAMLRLEGFPLADHAEVAYGKSKMVVDSAVVSIAQRDVPEALITVPKNYRALNHLP